MDSLWFAFSQSIGVCSFPCLWLMNANCVVYRKWSFYKLGNITKRIGNLYIKDLIVWSMSIIFRVDKVVSVDQENAKVYIKFICWVYNFRNLSCFMIRSLGGRGKLREKIRVQMVKLFIMGTSRMGRQMEVPVWRTLLIWLSTNSMLTRYCVFYSYWWTYYYWWFMQHFGHNFLLQNRGNSVQSNGVSTVGQDDKPYGLLPS